MVSDITEQKQAESERKITIDILRLINSANGLQDLIQMEPFVLRRILWFSRRETEK